MKLAVRATNQATFNINVQPSETIGDLKLKIQEDRGYRLEIQKIIFSGRVLDNATTIDTCGVHEGEYLILMFSRVFIISFIGNVYRKWLTSFYVKVAPAKVSGTTSATPPSPNTTTHGSNPPLALPTVGTASMAAISPTLCALSEAVTQVPTTLSDPMPRPLSTSSASDDSITDIFSPGAKTEAAITTIENMGFPRDQVEKAMKVSFNSPERAIEYLTSGIPPQLQSSGSSSYSNSGTDTEASDQNPINLREMKDTLMANPAMMQHLVQSLSNEHPDMAARLRDNPEAFFQMLESCQAGTGSFQVTRNEVDAIERLVSLGFSRQQALQAFLAADKDEVLAANLLSDGTFDDDDERRSHEDNPTIKSSVATSAIEEPTSSEKQGSTSTSESGGSNNTQRPSTSGSSSSNSSSTGIEGLGMSPTMLREMKDHLIANPMMRQRLAESLSADHPEIGNMLRDSPETFFRFFEGLQNRATTTQVTQEEESAIAQLVLLGFTRSQAMQAFFAADKNEDVAANLLFDGVFNDNEACN